MGRRRSPPTCVKCGDPTTNMADAGYYLCEPCEADLERLVDEFREDEARREAPQGEP